MQQRLEQWQKFIGIQLDFLFVHFFDSGGYEVFVGILGKRSLLLVN
jgi:hypothetical protein